MVSEVSQFSLIDIVFGEGGRYKFQGFHCLSDLRIASCALRSTTREHSRPYMITTGGQSMGWVGSLRFSPSCLQWCEGNGCRWGRFQSGWWHFATQAQSIDRAMMSTSQHWCDTWWALYTVETSGLLMFLGVPCEEEDSRANCKRKGIWAIEFAVWEGETQYLVWSKYHRTMRTPMVILENTPESCQCWYWVQLFYAMLDFHLC